MIAINMFPTPEQELRFNACDYDAHVNLGDITICVPGDNHEAFSDWLMGFWEQLTDYMAEYADKEHLTEYVQRAANQSGGNK